MFFKLVLEQVPSLFDVVCLSVTATRTNFCFISEGPTNGYEYASEQLLAADRDVRHSLICYVSFYMHAKRTQLHHARALEWYTLRGG